MLELLWKAAGMRSWITYSWVSRSQSLRQPVPPCGHQYKGEGRESEFLTITAPRVHCPALSFLLIQAFCCVSAQDRISSR